MPNKKFTFLELHLHESDVQFGPKGLDSLPLTDHSTETSDESADADDEASADSSGGRSKLLVLLLLAGLGVALRKFAGGDEEGVALENVTDLGVVTGDEGRETTGTDEEGEDDAVSIDIEDVEESESGGSRLGLLVGLVFVVAVAVIARKLLGGSEDLDELEALDDVRPEP